MAILLWTMGLSLLMQGCFSSAEQIEKGCSLWKQDGDNVYCEACHPGNRLVKRLGPNPRDLCTPCEPNTYTDDSSNYRCKRCTQCVEAHVLVKACTATTDTKCGCKEGLLCGDDSCSFCVKKCGRGQEPAEIDSCRPCPNGTFNDQIHQKCKPWSTKCLNPDQKIVAKGNATSDIKCADAHTESVTSSKQPVHNTEQVWPSVLSVIIVFVIGLIIIIIFIITAVCLKLHRSRKMVKKTITKTPIIRTPTDDPRTLIAIECSFHEAQQEQGSSTESLASKDSTKQLIG